MKHASATKFAIAALVAALSLPLAAQTAAGTPPPPQPEVGAPAAGSIGVDTAQQKLKEISVDKFEQAGFWVPSMSTDEGIVTGRLFKGSPAGKAAEPLPDERLINIDNTVADTQVLGVRVDFLRRGFNSFQVLAQKPIPIEGIAKTITVWVAGRNFNHLLKIIVADSYGSQFTLPLGSLNFQGWKKLSVAIPPQNADGRNGIIQRNFHSTTHMGLKVIGFKIECDPMEAFGVYYVYFDDLRAVTDLFAEDNRDPDDMPDSW